MEAASGTFHAQIFERGFSATSTHMNTQKPTTLASRLLLFVTLLFSSTMVQATMIHFHADMSGPAEAVANNSTGMGIADVYLDDVAKTMEVKVTFWDLVGVTTASHIHAATALPNVGAAGVATETPTFGGFPLGVTAGSYDHFFDLTLSASFNSAFITANGGTVASAFTAFENALLAEEAYLNIHTRTFGGGEIRGFLHAVPDSASTALLLSLGLSGLAVLSRRQRLCA